MLFAAVRRSLLALSDQSVTRLKWSLTDQSGQFLILARYGLSAYDPKQTLAVRCGNDFDAGFSPYRSTRLSR
jgi:hypothetical protein